MSHRNCPDTCAHPQTCPGWFTCTNVRQGTGACNCNGVRTEVLLATTKKANKAAKAFKAPSFIRQEATLHSKEHGESQGSPERHVEKEEGHNANVG